MSVGGRFVRAIAACALAASFLLVAAVYPSAAAPNNKDSFTTLTYNVAGLPQGISGSDPQTNSPLISPLLNAYDLVLLQEDWADPVPGVNVFYHEEVTAEAKHRYRSEPAPAPLGTDLRRFPSGPTLIADGLNRLSDYRFGKLERHMWNVCYGEFHWEVVRAVLSGIGVEDAVDETPLGGVLAGGAADCGAQKGFSVARTRIAPGVEIDVYNLHGEAGSGPEDMEARAAGFVQLARFIRRHSAGRPVIIGGDTNLHTEAVGGRTEDKQVWADFQDSTGVTDVCSVLDCGSDAGAIDKFAFRTSRRLSLEPVTAVVERERFTRDDGEPLSDHDPLMVRFSWKHRGP